jgi:TolB-like protein/tetratricopeptide (TPR) repeat protein
MQNSSASFRGSVDATHWTRERLDSWKEVASFFRREVRTVQLWEKSEGLPVRRQHHKKLGSVYAYRQELEAWWAARSAIGPGSMRASEFSTDRKQVADMPQSVPDGCRIITIPFEAIHSPLDRGPLRQIIEKFAEGLNSELVVELVRSNLQPVVLPIKSFPGPISSMVDLMKNTAREFGADLLLNGSIRYSGNRIRVSAQVIRAFDSLCIWSECFDAGLDNILTAQAELANRIARALPDPSTLPEPFREQNLAADYNVAWYACSMGFHFWQLRGTSALIKALTYFEDAIELEPRCADAHAGLADTFVSLSYNHLKPAREAGKKASAAVQTALSLDRQSIKVRNALINLLIHCDWDLSGAERECRELLDSGQNDSRTIQLYSSLMNLRGRHQDAISLALSAYRLAPDSDLICGQVSLAYFYAGDYGSALSFIRRTIDLQPQYLMGYALLGRTEAELGNWDDAIKAFQRGLEISPRCSFIKALLAYAHAGGGEAMKAQSILRELEDESQGDYFPAYDVSAVHAILNQENDALQNIHRAYGERDMKTIFIQHDPRFARLRKTPGFQQIASALDARAS